MWKAWIGFNASHSLGAILSVRFSAIWRFEQPMLLFHSYFLGFTGLIALGSYLAMAKRYWFIRPVAGHLAGTPVLRRRICPRNIRVFA